MIVVGLSCSLGVSCYFSHLDAVALLKQLHLTTVSPPHWFRLCLPPPPQVHHQGPLHRGHRAGGGEAVPLDHCQHWAGGAAVWLPHHIKLLITIPFPHEILSFSAWPFPYRGYRRDEQLYRKNAECAAFVGVGLLEPSENVVAGADQMRFGLLNINLMGAVLGIFWNKISQKKNH